MNKKHYTIPHALAGTCDSKVLLRLPPEMVNDLDVVAHSRLMSRTAVIREYLSEKLENDLQSLSDQLEKMKGLRENTAEIRNW